MAKCDITQSFSGPDCKNTVAGLKAIYVANYEDYDWDLSEDDTDGIIIEDLPDNMSEVFKFPLKNTGNDFEEEIESDRDNGTTVFNSTLNFVFTSIAAKKHFQVKMLAWGRPIIFIETNAGDFLAMGIENGVEVGGTVTVEGEMSGANQYALTGEATERTLSPFLDGDAITTLEGLVDGSET